MANAQKNPKTKVKDDNRTAVVGGVAGKEVENTVSFEDEAKVVAEIKSTAAAIDKEAWERVRADVPEAKQAFGEAELPPDLEDSGIVSPPIEADKVVSRGTTISLPISKKEYEKGQRERFVGHASSGKSFVGVSSLIALSMWIGRLIKMAHKHAMRVVFRKGDE